MAIALWIPALIPASASAQTEDYTQWAYSSRFAINTSTTGADARNELVNFPMLVRLPPNHPAFFQAMVDGADIRFSDPDGTRLSYEVERWDKAGRKAEIWVRIPKVEGNSDRDSFTMHWGKAGAASRSDGSGVFSEGGVQLATYHLAEKGTAERANSAQPAIRAVPTNYDGDEDKEGVVGRCDSLDGTGDNLQLSSGFDDFTQGFTFMAWSNPAANGAWERLLDLGNGSPMDNIVLSREAETEKFSANIYEWGQTGSRVIATMGMEKGRWRHIAFTLQGRQARLYVDGVLDGEGTFNEDIRKVVRTRNYLGRSNWANNPYFRGKMDEVGLARTVRGSSWIKLSYENQKPGSAVLTETIALAKPLALVEGPKAANVPEGLAFRLQAVVLSTAPVQYQWYKDGLPAGIQVQAPHATAGPDTVAYAVAVAAPSHAGSYTCVITDGLDTVKAGPVAVTVTENLSLWPRTVKIGFNTTASGSNTPDSVRNFPVPVRIDNSRFDFSSFASGGTDIRFTDPDGTALSHAVAWWDGSAKKGEVWVRVPQVDGNSDRDHITMHWGRAGEGSSGSGPLVFRPEQGFLGVWHFSEASGTTAADHSSKGNIGRMSGGTVLGAPGVLGAAFSFNGGTSRVNLPTAMPEGLKAFTVNLWAKEKTARACEDAAFLICPTLFGGETGSYGSGDFWIGSNQGKLGFATGLGGGGKDTTVQTTASLSDGKWHHVAATYDGAELKLYQDGALVGKAKASGMALDPNPFDIGNLHWSDDSHTDGFQGDIDEVQFSEVAHGANWIKLVYEVQREDGKTMVYGSAAREPPPAPVFLPAAGAYQGPLSVSIGSADGAATIHYTGNGTNPEPGQAGTQTYLNPIVLHKGAIIRAVAVRDGLSSGVAEAAYSITRTLRLRDTLLAGEEGILPGGHVLRYPAGGGTSALFVDIDTSGSFRPQGFEVLGPVLGLATEAGAAWPTVQIGLNGLRGPMSLFRIVSGGAVLRDTTSPGLLIVPSAGSWFWGLDLAAPTLRIESPPALHGDTLKVSFLPDDNVSNLRCRLEWWSSGRDSTAWSACAAGEPASLSVPLKDPGFAPLEVRLSASDGGIEAHHPDGTAHAVTVSHPLPSTAGPVALQSGRRWALVSLPVSAGEHLHLEDLAAGNGGAGLAAGVWEGSPDLPQEGTYRLLSGQDTLPLGGAVWLSSDAAVAGLALSGVRSLASDSQGSFPIRLRKGWNLVGGPSLRALPWVASRGEGDAYLQSDVKALHRFTGSGYEESDTLRPWEGYFAYHHGGDTVLEVRPIPPEAALAKISAGAFSAASPAPSGARGAGVTAGLRGLGATLRLGARSWASSGLSVEDEPEPPSPDGAARPRLLREGRALSGDYLRMEGDLLRWTVAAAGPSGGNLDITRLSLPAGWQAWALSRSGGARHRLVPGGILPLAAGDTVALLAGTPAALSSLPEWAASREAPDRAGASLRRDAAGPYLHLALPGLSKVAWTVWRADGRRAVGRAGLELGPGWHRIGLDPGRGALAPGVYWVDVEAEGKGWRLRLALPMGRL